MAYYGERITRAKPLTTSEAGIMLGISQQTAIRMFDMGELSGFRVPGSKHRGVYFKSVLDFLSHDSGNKRDFYLPMLSFLEQTGYALENGINGEDLQLDVAPLIGNKDLRFHPASVSYTTGEAAKLARVSQQTMIRCFNKEMLKGVRVGKGRFRRIHADSLAHMFSSEGMPIPDNLRATSTYFLDYPGWGGEDAFQTDEPEVWYSANARTDSAVVRVPTTREGLFVKRTPTYQNDDGLAHELYLLGPTFRDGHLIDRSTHVQSIGRLLGTGRDIWTEKRSDEPQIFHTALKAMEPYKHNHPLSV